MKGKVEEMEINKEDDAEDWCFVCKDGGTLIVCDHKDCLKSYHPGCVGQDDSSLETGNQWLCNLHSCYKCHRTSKWKCYGCPIAVCGRCVRSRDFVLVKGRKGFCAECLKLALLVEEKKDVDSDGEKVNFKDKDTYEGLFKEYWEIINETEKLTLEELISANARLKGIKNVKPSGKDSSSDEVQLISEHEEDSDSVKSHKKEKKKKSKKQKPPSKGGKAKSKKPETCDSSDDDQMIFDSEDSDMVESHKQEKNKKRTNRQRSSKRGKAKSNQMEFVGWGSKALMQFLRSVGKSTTEKFSQHDATNIINGYIKENQLLDSQNKRSVLCDENLKSLFGRKIINKHRIYDLLEPHFTENQEHSDEDEVVEISEDSDESDSVAGNKKRKPSFDDVSEKKEVPLRVSRFPFASIVPENIKLVYLRRDLVQRLSEQPETFEEKLIGSFVRVRYIPKGSTRKNLFRLFQVTGVKKSSGTENGDQIFLQAADMPEDICIDSLSDDMFSAEECEAYRNRVKGGELKKLLVDELEQKAKILHEDITKDWIPRELILLQHRIDRANEKGWRRERFEYIERKLLLGKPTEQTRLLQKVPTVIPDEEVEPVYEDTEDDKERDKGLLSSVLIGTSESPHDSKKSIKGSSVISMIKGKSLAKDFIIGSVKDGQGTAAAIIPDSAAKEMNANTCAETTKENKITWEDNEKMVMSEAPAKEEVASVASGEEQMECEMGNVKREMVTVWSNDDEGGKSENKVTWEHNEKMVMSEAPAKEEMASVAPGEDQMGCEMGNVKRDMVTVWSNDDESGKSENKITWEHNEKMVMSEAPAKEEMASVASGEEQMECEIGNVKHDMAMVWSNDDGSGKSGDALVKQQMCSGGEGGKLVPQKVVKPEIS